MNTFVQVILLQAGGEGVLSFLPLVLMFVVVYFFMIRPQQKKQKDQQKFIDNLKKGDEVVTTGGMHGKIVEMDNHSVTLDVGKSVRIRFSKTFISRENTELPEAKK
ncbi:MAG: preprotein translocase subunit YajC [Bernardetiaceae bacterium]